MGPGGLALRRCRSATDAVSTRGSHARLLPCSWRYLRADFSLAHGVGDRVKSGVYRRYIDAMQINKMHEKRSLSRPVAGSVILNSIGPRRTLLRAWYSSLFAESMNSSSSGGGTPTSFACVSFLYRTSVNGGVRSRVSPCVPCRTV